MIKNLEIGKLPFIIFLVVLKCYHNCPHKREADRDSITKDRGDVMTSAGREI